jgi:putative transposase
VLTGNGYRIEPTPAGGPEQTVERKPRARKRPKGAPTHVRSWPLRPNPAQCRDIRTRFFTGTRVYNAVLGVFIGRSRVVKGDPAWQAARLLPGRTTAERRAPGAAFRAVELTHRFTNDAAQSFASGLRTAWVREQLPAQETQNLGVRAFDAVSGMWDVKASRGSSRYRVGCIHFRPRTAMVHYDRNSMRAAGWWGCSGVRGSSSRSPRRPSRGGAVRNNRPNYPRSKR